MKAFEALETLDLLGANQWGLVTAAQARVAGVSNLTLSRLADGGTLQRVRHGVYALPSAGTDRFQDLRAAWLSTDPGLTPSERLASPEPVVVARDSAALLHQLGDVLPAQHQFVSEARKQTSQADVRITRSKLPPSDVTTMHGLPVTTVPRTVADLTKMGLDADHLREVLRDALRTRDADYDDLAASIDARSARYGYRSGHALLEALVPQVPSQIADLTTRLVARTNMTVPQETLDALAKLRTALSPDAEGAATRLVRAIAPLLAALPTISASDLLPLVEAVQRALPKESLDGTHAPRASEAEPHSDGTASE